MDLQINRGHARTARPDSMTCCPAARALTSVFGYGVVYVNGSKQMWCGVGPKNPCLGAPLKRVRVPRELAAVIRAYDKGAPFRVGTYRIPGLKRPKK